MAEKRTPLDRYLSAGLLAGAVAIILLAGVRSALMDTGLGDFLEFLAGIAEGAAVVVVAVLALRIAARFLAPVQAGHLATLIGLVIAVTYVASTSPAEAWRTVIDRESWAWPLSVPDGLAAPSIGVVVAAFASVCGWFWMVRDRQSAPSAMHIGSLAALSLGLVAAALYVVVSLASDGRDPYPTEYRALANGALPPSSAVDPSSQGGHTVEVLSYGYGENARRPEFGRRRVLESRAVDATALLPEWDGIKKKMRERYWGFGLDAAPLNGLVWAPEGQGPFPLVLIVHGNHGMEEFSDPGYEYLGRLLASQGMIAVSVDENYINGSWSGDFRGKEMAARAWLLLEHLSLWRDWNSTADHRFERRVDMDNIALIGHSRGGEALPIAYTMNALSHHPDDATIRFDYEFSIRSLIAIAQVDQRYHRRLELEDVNFLALQGSYDSDEPAFHGMRQYNRLALSDDEYRFKAGVYIHGANHGQFNSIWGREDTRAPYAWRLNLAPLIAPEDQQQVAKVYVAAFLMTTLMGQDDYLPLFRDPRVGAAWLPDLPLVQQFMDSTFVPIANFEEDLDVLTGTAEGSIVRTQGLAVWREEELKHRDERPQGSSAVVLGWDAAQAASYEIELPRAFWASVDDRDAWLTFNVSGSTEKPADSEADDAEDTSADADDEPPVPEFVLEVESFDGAVRTLHSSDIAHLAPPLRVRYLKHEASNRAQYNDVWEPVLQYVEVPLDRLLDRSSDERGFRYLRLRLESSTPGVIIVDNIALRRPVLAREP